MKLPKELSREELIKLLSSIDEQKKARILKLVKPDDRIRSLLADCLVRYLATWELGIRNSQITYEYNGRGKPRLKGRKDFEFNVSHSGDYVACAISSAPVGCDIQQMIPCDIAMGNIIFTPQEQALIHDEEEFYRMWSLKEALLKAIGIGISVEGVKLNMVQEGNVSSVTYKKKKYYAKHFSDAVKDYSLSLWSADKTMEDEVIEISYKML